MKKLVLITILLVTGVVALEPFGVVMPTNAQMTAAGLLLGVLVFTLGVLWREQPADEREEELFNNRGKLAYFVGLAVGSVGLVVGAFSHTIDWWLVAVVGSMLAIKLFHKD